MKGQKLPSSFSSQSPPAQNPNPFHLFLFFSFFPFVSSFFFLYVNMGVYSKSTWISFCLMIKQILWSEWLEFYLFAAVAVNHYMNMVEFPKHLFSLFHFQFQIWCFHEWNCIWHGNWTYSENTHVRTDHENILRASCEPRMCIYSSDRYWQQAGMFNRCPISITNLLACVRHGHSIHSWESMWCRL